MNQRYRKEDGLDLAMFGLGPFIGKYGWVIADYSFKLMSWSLLVGTLEVFYEKTGLSVLWWTYNVGKGIFIIALLSLSYNLAWQTHTPSPTPLPSPEIKTPGQGKICLGCACGMRDACAGCAWRIGEACWT